VRPHFWSLRAAVSTLLAQNPILLGLFFTVPLYLQVVQGLDAFGPDCGCCRSRC
jgi:hypothetical protein